LAQGGNQASCAFSLASSLGLAFGTGTFDLLSRSDPVSRRNLYQAVYVPPGLADADYGFLRQMVMPGGFI